MSEQTEQEDYGPVLAALAAPPALTLLFLYSDTLDKWAWHLARWFEDKPYNGDRFKYSLYISLAILLVHIFLFSFSLRQFKKKWQLDGKPDYLLFIAMEILYLFTMVCLVGSCLMSCFDLVFAEGPRL